MGKKRGKSNPHFVLQHVKELLEHGAVHSKEVANIEAIEEQIQPQKVSWKRSEDFVKENREQVVPPPPDGSVA